MQLVLRRPNGATREFLIAAVTVIGRREDCDLRIPIGDVSRRHCVVQVDAGGVSIRDLGSSNGTFVNDRRVQESPLLAGDLVTIGSLTFLVRVNGLPEDVAASSKAGVALEQVAGGPDTTVAGHLDPTAQADAGDFNGLDPSAASADLDDLMND